MPKTEASESTEAGKDVLISERTWTVLRFDYLNSFFGQRTSREYVFDHIIGSPKAAWDELMEQLAHSIDKDDPKNVDKKILFEELIGAMSFITFKKNERTVLFDGEEVKQSTPEFARSKVQILDGRRLTLDEAIEDYKKLEAQANGVLYDVLTPILRDNHRQIEKVYDGEAECVVKTRGYEVYAFDPEKHEILETGFPRVSFRLRNRYE